MVFLGGAVLANIVSMIRHYNESMNTDIITDGRQGKHVDLKAGVGRTRRTRPREVGRPMSDRPSRTLYIPLFSRRQSKEFRAYYFHELSSLKLPEVLTISVIFDDVCQRSRVQPLPSRQELDRSRILQSLADSQILTITSCFLAIGSTSRSR